MDSAINIGMFGTFDVENYGDMLFPIVAERELKKRNERIKLVLYSYNAKEEPSWPFVVHSIADLDKKSADLTAVLVGGGHIIRLDKAVAENYAPPAPNLHHPSSYWLAPALAGIACGLPVIWNGPSASPNLDQWAHLLVQGALEGSSYISVRDEVSRDYLRNISPQSQIEVIPDTVFNISRLLGEGELQQEAAEALKTAGITKPFVVVHACHNTFSVVKALSEIEGFLDEYDILAIPIGPILGDSIDILAGINGLHVLREWPAPLLFVRIVEMSRGVVAASLHLTIIALAFGKPVARPAFLKAPKLEFIEQDFDIVFSDGDAHQLQAYIDRLKFTHKVEKVTTLQSDLDAHWDKVVSSCLSQGQINFADAFARWASIPLNLERQSKLQREEIEYRIGVHQAEAEAARAKAEAAEIKANNIQADLNGIQEDLLRISSKNAALTSELQNSYGVIAEQKGIISVQEADYSEMYAVKESLNAANLSLNVRLEDLSNELFEVRDTLGSVLSSKSWRWTENFRRIWEIFR